MKKKIIWVLFLLSCFLFLNQFEKEAGYAQTIQNSVIMNNEIVETPLSFQNEIKDSDYLNNQLLNGTVLYAIWI